MSAPEPYAPLGEATSHTIEVRDVVVDLGGRRVLDSVSVEFSAQRVAVIGANGSGKSTFARLLNALVSPSSGSVRVHGQDPLAARKHIGFVFSSPDAQILMPTVAEDVALSLRGGDKAEVRARVDSTLAAYGLAAHADAPVHTLSGGQKQLLAFASVLVGEPTLLVADEPTTLLDRRNARRIGDLLIDELPMQTVIVTHDLELASRCDLAILIDDGRVHAVGDASEIVAAYRGMYA